MPARASRAQPARTRTRQEPCSAPPAATVLRSTLKARCPALLARLAATPQTSGRLSARRVLSAVRPRHKAPRNAPPAGRALHSRSPDSPHVPAASPAHGNPSSTPQHAWRVRPASSARATMRSSAPTARRATCSQRRDNLDAYRAGPGQCTLSLHFTPFAPLDWSLLSLWFLCLWLVCVCPPACRASVPFPT